MAILPVFDTHFILQSTTLQCHNEDGDMSLFLITMLWGLLGVSRSLTTSADGIAADIRTEIESYMEQWFNKKKIEEIYNTQTYTTLTGKDLGYIL